jgi:hypothetical protein
MSTKNRKSTWKSQRQPQVSETVRLDRAACTALNHIYEHFKKCECERALASVESSANVIIADIQLSHEGPPNEPIYAESDLVQEAVREVLVGHSIGAVFAALRTLSGEFADILQGEPCCDVPLDEAFMHNAHAVIVEKVTNEPAPLTGVN